MEGKNSVKIYTNWFDTLDEATDEQIGVLFRHLGEYIRDLNPDDSKLPKELKLTWVAIKSVLKHDLKEWLKVCDKNRENVNKRWNTKDTTVYDRKRPNTTYTDKDKDKDKDKYIGPQSFYENEITKCNGSSEGLIYKAVVDVILGKSSGEPLTNVMKLPNQLTFEQCASIYQDYRNKGVKLTEILEEMDNNPKSIKGKQYVSRTARSWMNIRLKK